MKSLTEILWEILQFWKKPKKLKLDEDFQFHDFPDTDLTGIRILKGPYAGVLYYYTNAAVEEQGYLATLKFGYMIVDSANYAKNELEKDEKCVTMLGDILSEIILMEGNFESPRTFYSEKSDL
jgi:hypothetical protein